jgi:hypothetical protein
MRKTFVLAVLLLPGLSLSAQELPPGLPGISSGDTPAAEEAAIQRPDAIRILADLGPELRLSASQEQRITKVVDKKGEEFDVMFGEYEKAEAEEKQWRYKVNDLKHRLGGINGSIPDGIRDLLDDEQRQNFDTLLEARRNPQPAAPSEAVSGTNPETSVAAPKHLKKKRLIKRKKLPPAGAAAAMPAQSAPAAAVPVGEDGQTMVDNDSSPVRKPARKKRRVLRRKITPAAPVVPAAPAAPAAAPAVAAPSEPAEAAPAPEETPAAEEDAGSYP